MTSEIMTPATQPPSESTLFARSLKKYEDITFEKNKTCRAVVAFDEDLFHRTCSKISDCCNTRSQESSSSTELAHL